MTSPLGGFLEGETGSITYPVPIYIIEHNDALVVVDTGLHADFATSQERLGPLASSFTAHLPADGSGSLAPVVTAAGFDPAAVELLVLTHLHFDHTGGIAELPNARIVVQEREWAQLGNEQLVAVGAYNPADVEHGHDRQEIDGDHDLFGDGTVTCLLTDGHTAGHQSVRVLVDGHAYVICGDCCYLRRTVSHEHLPPFAHDRDRQLQSVRRLAGEQAAGATLLFGHDPEQWAELEATELRPTFP